jgi:hypothetical protein
VPAYVFALARELKQEYKFIVAEGHVLQIESPDPRHRTRSPLNTDSVEAAKSK